MAKESTNKPWAARLRTWEAKASAPLPPSGDWDRLAKKMVPQEKRKNRLPLWWLGLALVGGLLLAYWWPAQEPMEAAVPTSPIVLNAQKATTPNLLPQRDTVATNAAEKLPAEKSQRPSSTKASAQSPTVAKEPLPTNSKQQQPTTTTSLPTVTLPMVPATRSTQTAAQKGTAVVSLLASAPIPLLSEKQRPFELTTLVPSTVMTPDFKQKNQRKWAVGPTLQIAQNSLTSGNSAGLRPVSSEQQQALNTGLALRGSIGSRWGVQLGISRGQEAVSSRYRFQRIYTASNEQTTTNGENVNNFSVELDGKYTKTDADIEVSRSANQPLGSQRRLVIEAQLEERVRTTQVPLLLTYDLPLGSRLSLRLGSGVSWQGHQIQTEQQARLIQAGRFQVRRSRTLSRTTLVNESQWLGQLSLGLDYQLGNRWSLIGQTNAYTQLGSALSDAGNRVNYQGMGGQLLLLYHF